MASKGDQRDEKLMIDERIMNRTSDFFSRNAIKFVGLFVVVMAAVVVYVVHGYVGASRERALGDYLEEHFYPAIGETALALPGVKDERVDVREVLAKTEGSPVRPKVLYELAQYLFQKGGPENLAEADRIVRLLKDETEASHRYQVLADNLRVKIAEERVPERCPG